MLPPLLLLAPCLVLAAPQAAADPQAKAQADSFKPDPAWKPLGPGLWFDPAQRRLALRARVVLREGYLEHLLCLENTKEHESILATPAPPRMIHAGLLLTKAEKGHPVRYRPKFEPPAGTPIAIELEWTEGGKAQRAGAREWIKDGKLDKTLGQDWVFAGSDEFEDPDTKKMIYAADEGDLITVANFQSAILDLPFASSSADQDRSFVANTARIPPRGTYVTMYLRPAKAAPKP
jgi:hypothetical protein